MDEADLPLTEDSPLRPVTPYGAAKAAADLLTLQAFLGDGLGAIRVRPFSHTGPGQSARFVVPALAARIARAERDEIEQIPVGLARRGARPHRRARRRPRLPAASPSTATPGDVYNVCSGTGVSVQEIADRLLARASRPIRLVTDPELVRPVEVPAPRREQRPAARRHRLGARRSRSTRPSPTSSTTPADAL